MPNYDIIPSWSIQDKHIALMQGIRQNRVLRCWSCLLRHQNGAQ